MGGSNVDNCPHACVARPCGPLAKCIPNLESYECQCNPLNAQCNRAEEVSVSQIEDEMRRIYIDSTTITATTKINDEEITTIETIFSSSTTTEQQEEEEEENLIKNIKSKFDDDNDDNYEYYYEDDNKMSNKNNENEITKDDDKILDDVTRVNGRYMSVDTEKLLRNDKILNKQKQNLAAQSLQPQTDEDFETEMEKIMKNPEGKLKYVNEIGYNINNYERRDRGACFTGTDSYLHFSDAETMRRIISYQIDLNLRFKTHSSHGLVLWSGRHSALEDDDYLSLGIENGLEICFLSIFFSLSKFFCLHRYLHLRYNLGSGEVNIKYNSTKVSDGLWHRIRATR